MFTGLQNVILPLKFNKLPSYQWWKIKNPGGSDSHCANLGQNRPKFYWENDGHTSTNCYSYQALSRNQEGTLSLQSHEIKQLWHDLVRDEKSSLHFVNLYVCRRWLFVAKNLPVKENLGHPIVHRASSERFSKTAWFQTSHQKIAYSKLRLSFTRPLIWCKDPVT